MPVQDTQTLEARALRFYEAGEQIKKLTEERDQIRFYIGDMMGISEQDEYRFGLDPLFDIKVTVRDRTSKKIAKQELATDLGVAESAINIEFLLSAVENGKLSLARFKQYMFNETNEQVSIRKVNADN
ncbi:hypothetical protein [Brevibacillus laterosporus]|uniref:hypothetical protein n=1 Tax=Brevibacillus laterosporus TaxID=1465 RepID=UPI003D212186